MVVRKVYHVGEVTSYLHDLLEADTLLSELWVRGEISNFKHHTSGHFYFTLKDEGSCLRCVMFRSRAVRVNFLPANGMNVLVRGCISVYERDGVYQLYAEELAPDGTGALYQAYCRLKDRLQAEGLFEAGHKRPLSSLPRKVGVVTSANGAAWHDLIQVMHRRYPGLPMVLAPAAVQGEQAPAQICAAISLLNQRADIEVIITGRGGGSLEELWAFNTEEVARAIYGSRVPVVSAVGHETDFTIADLVADLRAPTPSAAAEIVAPERVFLEHRVRLCQDRLLAAVASQQRESRQSLEDVSAQRLAALLLNLLAGRKESVKLSSLRLLQRIKTLNESGHSVCRELAGKLEALSPLAILERGYSLCRHPESGRLITGCREVSVPDRLEVLLKDGRLQCLVEDVKEDPAWLKKLPESQN